MLLLRIDQNRPLHAGQDLLDAGRRVVLGIGTEFEPDQLAPRFPNSGLTCFASVVFKEESVWQRPQDAFHPFGVFLFLFSFVSQLFRITQEVLKPVVLSPTLFLVKRLVVKGNEQAGEGVASLYHESGLRTARCFLALPEHVLHQLVIGLHFVRDGPPDQLDGRYRRRALCNTSDSGAERQGRTDSRNVPKWDQFHKE